MEKNAKYLPKKQKIVIKRVKKQINFFFFQINFFLKKKKKQIN